jgi:ubiquinone biosynthesis protein
MRRFVVQVLIDTVALLVAILVLSRIEVAQPFPFGTGTAPVITILDQAHFWLAMVATGAILTVTYSILRPAIIMLTGRLLLWSMGLFQIVVIGIVLWVVGLVTPLNREAAEPRWLWLLVGALFVGAVRVVLGAILGLAGPQTSPGRRRLLWQWLDRLPTPRRSALIENLRLQQVYDTLYGFGAEIFLEQTPLAPIRAWSQRVLLGETRPPADLSTAGKVRRMLQDLGPTYVKLGQIVASRGDALPGDWAVELTKLQSEVAPVSWEKARAVIVRELGGPPEHFFATIDEEPLAAASTAQVHRATLHDGTVVAVKVQRPDILAMTKADLGVIQEIARLGARRLDMARKVDLEGIAREYASGILKELDYQNEAYNARRLTDGMAKFEQVHIPAVYSQLSTSRVLTEEFVTGIKISDVAALDAAGMDRADLGRTFVRALIKQVLVDGFFHGDPHPGNVLVDPSTRRIMFIDLGMVGLLTSQQRLDLLDLIFSLTAKDSDGVATTLIGLSTKTPVFDEPAFRRAIDQVLRRYLMYGESASLATGLGAVLSVVYDNGLRLNNQLTLAIKAVIQAEETATALSPDIDLAATAMEESRAALLDGMTADNIEKVAKQQALRVGRQLLRRLPEMESGIWKWIDQVGKGQLTIKLDTSDLGKQFGTLNRIGSSLTIGMILAGALVGMAIVAVVLLQPGIADTLGPIPGIAAFAFLALLVYSLVLVTRFARGLNDGDNEPR